MIINTFALTGRIVICDTFTQGDALGYVLLPLWGVLLRLLTPPSCQTYILYKVYLQYEKLRQALLVGLF